MKFNDFRYLFGKLQNKNKAPQGECAPKMIQMCNVIKLLSIGKDDRVTSCASTAFHTGFSMTR